VQPALYAGGAFYLKKWNTSDWSVLLAFTGRVDTLRVHDDGQSSSLYVGGWHPVPPQDPNDINYYHLARWDGAWHIDTPGPKDHVWALGALADGLRRPDEPAALYAGGHFVTAANDAWPGIDSQYIARWGCLSACRGDLNYDFEVGLEDINPFILAFDPDAYAATYPGLAETSATGSQYTGGLVLFLGDLNCDGTVGFRDINPFVARLSQGCCWSECGNCPGDAGDSAPRSPEELAAMLAANVDPALYDSLVTLVGQNASQQETKEDAAYWEAVYLALIQ